MACLPLRLAPFGLLIVLSSPLQSYSVVVTKAIQASTIAEIYVSQDKVLVESERLPSDPELWRHLILSTGKRIPARLLETSHRQRVARDEITGQPLDGQMGEPVVFERFEYPLSSRPPKLTLSGPRVGFIVYHLGLPVTDLHYLDGGETLDLDWSDPWNSRFRSAKLRRQYDSRLSVFLYIEPYEVRAEVVLRPVDCDERIGRLIRGRSVIPAAEQARLQSAVASLLRNNFSLEIDGVRVQPELDRTHFLRRSLYASSVIDPPEDLPASSATLGVIFVAPVNGFPRTVTFTWDLFTTAILQVAASVTDPAAPQMAMLRPTQRSIRWRNLLKNVSIPSMVPVVAPPRPLFRYLPIPGAIAALSLVWFSVTMTRGIRRGKRPSRQMLLAAFALLAIAGGAFSLTGSSTVSDRQASTILHGLLSNIYRAFDFRDEATVYDLLARSVSGDLLRDTYLETRNALEVRTQGGARSKVKQVEIIRIGTTALRMETGFRARCVWNVAATVSHWGHVHERRNQYEALITVRAVDGVWKITAMELVSEARL